MSFRIRKTKKLAQAAFDGAVRAWLEDHAFPIAVWSATVTRFSKFAEVRVDAKRIDAVTIQVRVQISGEHLTSDAFSGLWIVVSHRFEPITDFTVHVNIPVEQFEYQGDVEIIASPGKRDRIRVAV